MELKFSELVKSQQNVCLLRVQYTLCVTDKIKTHLSKKLKTKKICVKEFFFPTNDFSLLENCQLYIIANYKPSNCCKIEAVIQRFSVKKVLLKIHRKTPCVRALFQKICSLQRDSGTGVFPRILQYFYKHVFYRTPTMAGGGKIRGKVCDNVSEILSFSYFWLHLISWAPSIL